MIAKQAKITKRSLIFSLVSLLICVSMLVGTTFAWFTDSVASGGNIIKSGNLKIKMYWTDDLENGEWHDVEEAATSAMFTYQLWEPGFSEVRYLKLVNTGNLALKYRLTIKPVGTVGDLADSIDVKYIPNVTANIDERTDFNALPTVGTLREVVTGISAGTISLPEGVLLPESEVDSTQMSGPSNETCCVLALHMQESAGNEYQAGSIGEGFYVSAVATQWTYEDDSFDQNYDEEAIFPNLNLAETLTFGVSTNDAGQVTEEMTLTDGNSISATVPAGAQLAEGEDNLVLKVTTVSSEGIISSQDGDVITRVIDVHMDGLSTENTAPIRITIERALMRHMGASSIALYHQENGVKVLMTKRDSADDVTAHNDYYYDPETGDVTMALASFSNILFEVNPSAPWGGSGETSSPAIADHSAFAYTGADIDWYKSTDTEFTLTTAEQLYGLAKLVNLGTDTFEGKTIKLGRDIVINDWKVGETDYRALDFADSSTNDPAFENNGTNFKYFPTIGSYDNDTYRPFMGTFDGQGHKISGLFNLYYDDPMEKRNIGLFGMVEDATIQNLTVSDCFFYTYGGMIGMVATRAYGSCTFENIRVTENFATQYNYYLGGIVGYAYSGGNTTINLNNCYVDNTNKFEALWGTYDAAVGGLVGAVGAKNYESAPTINITNCTVFPTVSLYNDCCANYQWFAYRYSGMLVGYVNASDRAQYLATKVNCSNTTVKYGEWTDMYYCEFVKNGHPSYCEPHDWKYSRIPKSEVVYNEAGGKWECVGHDHASAGDHLGQTFEFKGQTYYYDDTDENNSCVNLPFNQLFGGGQGVYGETNETYLTYCTANGKDETGVTVIDYGEGGISMETNLSYNGSYLYRVGNRNTVTLGAIYKLTNGSVSTNLARLSAEKITGVASVEYTPNASNWANGTLQFEGTGVVKLIFEYLDSAPMELYLEVVDAVNYPGGQVNGSNATFQADRYSVCLLGNIGLSGSEGLKIDEGYALYGNGFEINISGNGQTNATVGMSTGYITIRGGGLMDNVRVIAPDFPKAYMYSNGVAGYEGARESDNQVDDNHFAYQLSAVKTSVNAIITNSYIYGARNNILAEGNLTLDNCVLSNGALANIHMKDQNGSLHLNDVTTIQYIRTFQYTVPNPSVNPGLRDATVIGVGILMGPAPDSNVTISSNPELYITGYLAQYNWVCAAYKDQVNSSAVSKTLIETATSESDYYHNIDGTNYVDLGVIYLNSLNADSYIHDSSANNYLRKNISMSGQTGQAYAPSAGTSQYAEVKTGYNYNPNAQSLPMPVLTYSDTAENKTLERGSPLDYVFTATLNKNDPESPDYTYTFDFSKLAVTLLGEETSDFTIQDAAGNPVSKTGTVTMERAGTQRFTLTIDATGYYNQNGVFVEFEPGAGKTYTVSLALVTDLQGINPPEVRSASYGQVLKMVKSTLSSSDWTMAAQPLKGLVIRYYSTEAGNYVDLDLTDVLLGSTTDPGKTVSNDIEIAGADYTLRMSSTTIKGSENTWVDAGDRSLLSNNYSNLHLYVSAAELVSSNTTSRTTTVTYTFVDGCNHSLTFSKKYDCPQPTSDDTRYSHAQLLDDHKISEITVTNGGEAGSCVAAGTLITLADGSRKAVEELTGDELLLVWNLETGSYDAAPIVFVDSDPEADYEIIELGFSDGTSVKVISEHGFFDYDLARYVYLDENAARYIGHRFVNESGRVVTLTDVELYTQRTTAWSPVTFGHLCYYTNGMLSMPGGISGLFNIFQVDKHLMAYDPEAMRADIETYGLFAIEDFGGLISEEAFYAFNGAWLKVAMGKGLIDWETIAALAERYSPLYDDPN